MSARVSVLSSLLVTGLLSGLAFAGFTEALDPVADRVDARLETVDTTTKDGRKARRALRQAAKSLAKNAKSLRSDLATLRRCVQRLRKLLPDDPDLTADLDRALADLRAAALTERERVAGSVEDISSEKLRDRAISALDQFDALLTAADAEERADRAAKQIAKGLAKLHKIEKATGNGPMPKFRIPDVNAASARLGERISPRDHLSDISAWYFGHST